MFLVFNSTKTIQNSVFFRCSCTTIKITSACHEWADAGDKETGALMTHPLRFPTERRWRTPPSCPRPAAEAPPPPDYLKKGNPAVGETQIKKSCDETMSGEIAQVGRNQASGDFGLRCEKCANW